MLRERMASGKPMQASKEVVAAKASAGHLLCGREAVACFIAPCKSPGLFMGPTCLCGLRGP